MFSFTGFRFACEKRQQEKQKSAQLLLSFCTSIFLTRLFEH